MWCVSFLYRCINNCLLVHKLCLFHLVTHEGQLAGHIHVFYMCLNFQEILQLDNTLLHILSGVVSFARCAIDQDTLVVPHMFTEAVQQLHGNEGEGEGRGECECTK